MRSINKSGLAGLVPELLKTRIWAGISAGSMVTGPDLALSISQKLYREDLKETKNMSGLGLVDFYVLPHLNSPYFEVRRETIIQEQATGMTVPMYALDDQSALKVMDGKVEIISEGTVLSYNQ